MDERKDAEQIKDCCKAIIKEVDKWKKQPEGKKHPEAIFQHGYAREKADRIIFLLERHGG